MEHFELLHQDPASGARLGRLTTAHGIVNTPVFMPVGTRGTVKAMSPRELEELKVQIILGNTYHLFLRPGPELIEKAGGLHQFEDWHHPILTDSGGFQVFSLSNLRKMRPDGVEFASHIDGTRFFLGPRESMAIQRALGSDIVMSFDECTPFPCKYEDAAKSLEVTLRWEAMSREQKLKDHQLLFGIVQGSVYRDLRERSARELVKLGFDGYSIGGLSVGEPEEQMFECLEWVTPLLPKEKPRYLMGVDRHVRLRHADPSGPARLGVCPGREDHPGQGGKIPRGFLASGSDLLLLLLHAFHQGVHPASAECQRDSRNPSDYASQHPLLHGFDPAHPRTHRRGNAG